MPDFTLVIGNRNYSSWSLRPWMLMKHLGVAFREIQLRLDTPEFKDEFARIRAQRPGPVLKHGDAHRLGLARDLRVRRRVDAAAAGRRHRARAPSHAPCARRCTPDSPICAIEWPMNARARNRRRR